LTPDPNNKATFAWRGADDNSHPGAPVESEDNSSVGKKLGPGNGTWPGPKVTCQRQQFPAPFVERAGF